MERNPAAGDIYRHFKGNLYRIITLAEHSESGEQLVIYQGLYGTYPVYARPLAMFNEKVDKEKYPGAEAEYRFTRLPLVETVLPQAEPAYTEPVCAEPVKEAEPVAAVQTAIPEKAADEEEFELDPLLLAFLDADSYERKLEIFDSMLPRMDHSMLNTVAVSMDLELSEGSLEEQYYALRSCMLTLEKYECNRLR